MTHIDSKLARHRGLFVSAAGFRGVGIPDCIADARQTPALPQHSCVSDPMSHREAR